MHGFEGKRILVGLSGGIDSVVLLHLLARHHDVRAAHVHHGLSANADRWARFCRKLCHALGVPLAVRRVRVVRQGEGLEAAARSARYDALARLDYDVLALGHHLDDQAETILMNLLRGAGLRGARGMAPVSRFHGRLLVRPLLEVPRDAITAYARAQRLEWIEDESNTVEALTRNFIRHRVAPLLAQRYPRWREALARAARHFARADADARGLLREFLAAQGLRAPSEAKLVEMLKQLTGGGANTQIKHDGRELRVYRGKLSLTPARATRAGRSFREVAWRGERKLPLPELGGELRFRSVRGAGIDPKWLKQNAFMVKLRAGGERLQPDPRRPRRTLKNLFQEAGVPPWQRARLPLLYYDDALVWAPQLGVDARFQSAGSTRGWLPEWRVTC